MTAPTVERVPLASLTPDPGNPRERSSRAKGTLAASLREFGPARSAVVDGRGVIVAGNGTIEAAMAIGIRDAIVVDAPADALVVVRKPGFSPAQSRAYSVMDNQATDLSVFTDEGLEDAFDELIAADYSLGLTGFMPDEIDELMAEVAEAGGDEDEAEDDDGPIDDLFRPWPSDNEWGVPTLDPTRQGLADDLSGGVLKWGTRKRGLAGPRLIHFYTLDAKFWGLNRNPRVVVETGCKAVVEPNFSTTDDMARAEALWWVYSKRLVARWWQDKGLRVFVDLNVDPAFADLMLLGVPRGWRSYATRWHRGDDPSVMERDFGHAVERRGGEDVLFVVVGGGQKAKRLCQARGWRHIDEDSDSARGRV